MQVADFILAEHNALYRDAGIERIEQIISSDIAKKIATQVDQLKLWMNHFELGNSSTALLRELSPCVRTDENSFKTRVLSGETRHQRKRNDFR